MTERNELDSLLQIEWRNEVIPRLGTENWIIVYNKRDISARESALIYSGFVTESNRAEAKRADHWDIYVDQVEPMIVDRFDKVTGNKAHLFELFGGNRGISPFVYVRTFKGLRHSEIEILEDFRFFHGLYFESDSGCFVKFNVNGVPEPVVRVTIDNVSVRRRELRQYLSARQRYLVITVFRVVYSDIDLDSVEEAERSEVKKQDDFTYKFSVTQNRGVRPQTRTMSTIRAKKFLAPNEIEDSGLYPFEPERRRQYVRFIIGNDEQDQEVEYTCDPNSLGPDFADHTNLLPEYNIPVWFSSEVLPNEDSYRLYEGGLAGIFKIGEKNTVRFSTHAHGYISVELGHLGTYLPFAEQSRWRKFNVAPIEDRQFQHSNILKFHRNCVLFLNSFESMQNSWYEKMGWYLFHELVNDDKYHIEDLRQLVFNSYYDLDRFSLSMAKLTTDSINVSALIEHIPNCQPKTDCNRDKPKIAVLKEYFEASKYDDHDNDIKFLTDVNMLRSRSAAHRKSSNANRYESILERLYPEYRHFIQVADAVFINFTEFFDSLREHFCPDEAD